MLYVKYLYFGIEVKYYMFYSRGCVLFPIMNTDKPKLNHRIRQDAKQVLIISQEGKHAYLS